jgi:hypothetical protein
MKKTSTGMCLKFLVSLLAIVVISESELTDAFSDMPQEAVTVWAQGHACQEDESGPVYALPWENDDAFLARQNEAGTPVLLGAYRAVLHDPLPGEEYNVHLAASMLAGIVVKTGETFSQNGRLGPYTADKGFQRGPTYIGTQLTTTIGGGVCKIASTLYNVVVLSDLAVVERHCHTMPVPYVPYGQDATVAYGARDFRFRNDSSSPVMIWAQGIDNRLYIAFYGQASPPEITWSHDMTNVVKAQCMYKSTSELPAGMERVALEGMDGATVRSTVTAKYADGRVVVRDMGVSYYRPMPFIIEKGK